MLEREGFDNSEFDEDTRYWSIRCSQCEASTVNGIPLHEVGCPNEEH